MTDISAKILSFPVAEERHSIALTRALYVHKDVREELLQALIDQDLPARRRAANAAEELLFLILPGEDVELRRLLNARLIARKNDHG